MIARYAIPFFFLMTLVVIPVVMAVVFRRLLPRKCWRQVAFACTLLIYMAVGYGTFFGYQQLEVRHVEFASSDLPQAFDGYRIVQFSDAHVGTMTGSRQWMLARAVDSIMAQQPDAIVFTGDLQNIRPEELQEHALLLSRLHAKDGVFSVMGNHDYPTYLDCDEAEKESLCLLTEQMERQMGWRLLLNEHQVIRRGGDSIVIAGMENWGKAKRMPHKGDVKKTLAGLNIEHSSPDTRHPFIVMLQHDPTAWREKILPECHAQLTLSGHTHGGQMEFFGWSPVAWSYKEWSGMNYEGRRALYVSTGLGALIPFRLGQPGEIVVVTLKKVKE
ncbi:MAG: metallophosphoesterase [Prevotella sp.]|nr:metallophosphoesterase [Prevotella sp.]